MDNHESTMRYFEYLFLPLVIRIVKDKAREEVKKTNQAKIANLYIIISLAAKLYARQRLTCPP
jgi:hypothetical protein